MAGPAPIRSSYLILLFCVCSSLALLIRPAAADADLLQDFCVADLQSSVRVNGFPCKNAADVHIQDFVFSGVAHAGNTSATGFAGTLASVLQFPGLNTQGISMARADFAPGGLNVPHLHPRASELAIIIEGTFYAGFITTSNKLYAQTLHKGDLLIIPRGLVHFQLNIGSTPGVIMGALNSQNPGVQRLPVTLFGTDIEDEVLEKAFQLSRKAVEDLKAKLTPKS